MTRTHCDRCGKDIDDEYIIYVTDKFESEMTFCLDELPTLMALLPDKWIEIPRLSDSNFKKVEKWSKEGKEEK